MTTEEKYDLYEKLLAEWNEKMNLVAKSTLADIRRRHIDDSAQLAKYIPRGKTAIDLGSGAGFPGVVLAILGYDVVAIDSIGKKCLFLETLKEQLLLPNLEIINDRVENAVKNVIKSAKNGENFVFTARALAPLIRILDWTQKTGQEYVLMKGRNAAAEIAAARGKYSFRAESTPSETGDGYVIKLTIK
ncbi:MAG: 16S rRNA (guanine(527)-N(7))-methyltransferase RsmG [Rickettsiales bacterium]|jgi:16S rRNA (guanine527-N7)-methyltransferase|nr:16S rRNA (guanine(527)-N(7))-methyltransferase RsmG [Rickettsiales bacterium]